MDDNPMDGVAMPHAVPRPALSHREVQRAVVQIGTHWAVDVFAIRRPASLGGLACVVPETVGRPFDTADDRLDRAAGGAARRRPRRHGWKGGLQMRLLHTSDWHLGRSLHGASLLEHQRGFLRWLVRLAVE